MRRKRSTNERSTRTSPRAAASRDEDEDATRRRRREGDPRGRAASRFITHSPPTPSERRATRGGGEERRWTMERSVMGDRPLRLGVVREEYPPRRTREWRRRGGSTKSTPGRVPGSGRRVDASSRARTRSSGVEPTKMSKTTRYVNEARRRIVASTRARVRTRVAAAGRPRSRRSRRRERFPRNGRRRANRHQRIEKTPKKKASATKQTVSSVPRHRSRVRGAHSSRSI